MRPIAEYRGVDKEAFREKIRPAGEPAVFRDLAEHWPAVAAARRSNEDLVTYLKSFLIDRQVAVIVGEPEIDGRFLYTEDLRALNFTRGMSPLHPFLDRLLRDRNNPRPYAIAVQSEEVPGLLPGFQEENCTDLVDASI